MIDEIRCVNALEGLRQLPDESVDCVVTSPPYWSLRDYGIASTIWGNEDCKHEWSLESTKKINLVQSQLMSRPWRSRASSSTTTSGSFCTKCNAWKGQLGLEPTFELYIQHLCTLFDEVKRVLKKTGTCWVNLGDTYSGSNQGHGKKSIPNGHYANLGKIDRYLKKYAHLVGRSPPSSKTSVPEKSLCQIPSRFAVAMCSRGWILRNRIIWHKPNCMPHSVKDRFTVDYEDILFFVKSKKYWFAPQREPHKSASLQRIKHNWNGHREPMSSYAQMDIKKMCHPEGRNKRCVWTINTKPFNGAHFATYPEKLIETPIKAGCPEQGIVLDPFMGSGTTALVARKLNRRFIGFELNPSYIEIANARLQKINEAQS